MQSRLDRLLRQVQQFRGFSRGELLDVAQHEDGAVALRQRPDGGLQERPHFTPERLSLGIRTGRCGHHVLALPFAVRRDRLETPRPARAGPGFVERNAAEPGRKGRPAGELAQVLVGPDPGFLGDLLGLVVARQDRARQAVDALVVAAHEDLEELGVARTDSSDDLLV